MQRTLPKGQIFFSKELNVIKIKKLKTPIGSMIVFDSAIFF